MTQILRNHELTQIWVSLKSKNVQVQEEASIKLFEYLQKHSEEADGIFVEFRSQLESSKNEQKFGIFLALNKILHISRETQIVHYVKQLIPVLRSQLKINNRELVERGAECLGNLAEAGGSITAGVIDESLTDAIRWLQEDRNPRSTDIKKYSAVLILREFCCKQKVITFNKLFGQEHYYQVVFEAFKDNREFVRNTAAEVIKECIRQISERQQKRNQSNTTTEQIYQQVQQALLGNDPNNQQSALTVLGALISQRATSNEIIHEMNQGVVIVQCITSLNQTTRNPLVKKKCIEIIPTMYENIKHVFMKDRVLLENAIQEIINYIRQPNNKDRGQGFLSIGRMASIVDRETFIKYIDPILKLIENEITPPEAGKNGQLIPIANLDSLTCLRQLLRSYVNDFLSRNRIEMLKLINDIFYSGYNRQVIECLAEISQICGGKFKRAAQVKLLNTCYIILQRQKDQFPLNLEEQFLSTNDMMAYDVKPSGAMSARGTEVQPNSYEEVKVASGKAGSQTSRGENLSQPRFGTMTDLDTKSQPRFGTMAELDLKDSVVQQSGEKRRGGDTMIFSQHTEEHKRLGMQELRETNAAGSVKRKKQLQKFYDAVLDKNNQAFLYRLVKQSCMLQKDEKGKENPQGATERTQMVTLALRTLQMFDFQALAMSTVYFIENSVLNFLDDENPNVRKEAMRTCCGLSFPKTNHLRISSTMERIINKLLHRFFVTATTDNEDRIRVTMLKHLNPQFDPFISKYENLLMLFNCMQDQNFEIKERTVRILGRLVPHNASQILPYLRQLIVALISQIEQSNDAKEREEAVKLIMMFVKSAPDIAKSYSASILNSLIKKLDSERATSAFVSATLNVIAEIAKVNSDAIKPYLGDLFPLCLMCLKDQSSSIKRQMAIHTLISIIVNTGFVVKPYFYFPDLLTTITNLVQTEQQAKIRKLILKLIGTLGAVDPYLVKRIQRGQNTEADAGETEDALQFLYQFLPKDENDEGMRKIRQPDQRSHRSESGVASQQNAVAKLELNQQKKPVQANLTLVHYDELNLSKENRYTAMAIHHMLKVLVDSNLRDHHKVCLDSISYIIKNQPDSMPFMPMLIPVLMAMLKQNENILNDLLFTVITKIIKYIPEAMVQFADAIFEMIHEVIHIQPMPVMELLSEINTKYKACLFSHMYLVLPQVLLLIEVSRKKAEQAHSSQSNYVTEQIAVAQSAIFFLPKFDSQILDDHLYLIVPLLLRTAKKTGMNDALIQNGMSDAKIIHMAFISMNIKAIRTLNEMKRCSTFREHLAQVVHQLVRLLEMENVDPNLVEEIIRSFCEIAVKLNSDFAPYISLIQKAIRRNKLQDKSEAFESAIKVVTKNDPIEQFQQNLENIENDMQQAQTQDQLDNQMGGRDRENRVEHERQPELLLREFDTSKCHIADDWTRWLIKTSHQLLKQNPSPVLHACSTLTEVYAPLAQDLYCIAFLNCWRQMFQSEKEFIIKSFQAAKNAPGGNVQVLQQILNLAEFIELDESEDIKLFSAKTLAGIAENCNAFAKALYYWEQEFDNSPKETVEKLIQTNYQLQQPEAAEGILNYAKKNLLTEDKEDWYEKLQKWPEALEIYKDKPITRQNYVQVQRGKLTCYRNLMNWDELSKLVENMWDEHLREDDPIQKADIKNVVKEHAPMAVYAAWNLGNWNDMKTYARNLDPKMHGYEKNFYSAVYLIKVEDYPNAVTKIDNARDILNTKITSLLGESYNRAYAHIQELQFLKELEEVIEYKTTSSAEKRANLFNCWIQRQKSVPPQDLEVHQKLLNIRCLVKDKQEQIESFIQFAKMAQDMGNSKFSRKILLQLKKELYQGQDKLLNEESIQGSKSVFAIKEKHKKLINNLARVEIAISDALYNQTGSQGNQESFQKAKHVLMNLLKEPEDIEPQLLSVCHHKLGFWQFEFMESNKNLMQFEDRDYQEIVEHCEKATQINPQNLEAWHIFSTTNDEASIYYSKQFSKSYVQQQRLILKPGQTAYQLGQKFLLHREFGHNTLPKLLENRDQLGIKYTVEKQLAQKYVSHVVSAVTGLIQQLFLCSQVSAASQTKTLQTTLRLLKIWFQHGNLPEIEQKLRQGFEQIDLKVWIDVIPQLLARIDIKDQMIKQSLLNLVEKLSSKFPQALVYSLSVTKKSHTSERREAAAQLIEKLKTTQPVLIEQASIISDELNRSAILLAETWQEAIEEASRIYFGRNDGKAMFAYIEPYHKIMEKEPETMNEISFYQGYASDLLDAFSWMQRYKRTESTADINQAWDIYYSIFRKISSKQKEVQFYELRNVAPKLLKQENLEIAVPGTFKSNKPIVKISKFNQTLPVLSSKQHPRKMHMYGSDGREYIFLLKGHEDMRQDERVMQFFGLVNTLLSIDPQTSKKDLWIRRYPVIPLSQNTGLIGWVNNCDTLHILIKEHREENKILPSVDYKLMNDFCQHFEICPLPNKVEIFRHALEKTLGEDLKTVLWVKSQNSEVWLERRTNYTRSLAVMSMVGYILGLGDRHPSNIMLEKYTGRIVHIDFGDCFEIAMRREKFPEKIPFRLTRMLVRAMEVSGIEGNFKSTCENTIRVMRESRESLLAIMEAFVYDPLVSFRLLNPKMFKKQQKEGEEIAKQFVSQNEPASKVAAANTNSLNNEERKGQNDENDSDGSVDVCAEIEKSNKASIREKIIDNVLERIQRNNQSAVGRNMAESKFSRHVEDNEIRQLMEAEADKDARQNELNQIAEIVIKRVQDKLRGLEFQNPNKTAEVEQPLAPGQIGQQVGVGPMRHQKDFKQQVDILIKQATSYENLASCYVGWCPYW